MKERRKIIKINGIETEIILPVGILSEDFPDEINSQSTSQETKWK